MFSEGCEGKSERQVCQKMEVEGLLVDNVAPDDPLDGLKTKTVESNFICKARLFYDLAIKKTRFWLCGLL